MQIARSFSTYKPSTVDEYREIMKERLVLCIGLLYRTQKVCFNLWFYHIPLMWPLENCVCFEFKLYKHDNENSYTLYLTCCCITAFLEDAITFTTVTQCLEQWFVITSWSTLTQRILLEATNHPPLNI